MATDTGDQRSPIDLRPVRADNGFRAANAPVGLRIPGLLAEGAALTSSGLSLTPVDERGAALPGAEGAVDGATVFYGDVGDDMDAAIKPTTSGFEENTILRSANSPRELSFRVGLPTGAHLSQQTPGWGPIEIVDQGEVIATILAPGAVDAAGTPVPVTMDASKDILTLHVREQPGEFQYPIEVDPEVTDRGLAFCNGRPSNWEFKSSNEAIFGHSTECGSEEHLTTYLTSGYGGGEWAAWAYQTHGDSHIWELNAETEAKNASGHVEGFVELSHAKAPENTEAVREEKEIVSTNTGGTAEYPKRPLPHPLCNGPKNSEGFASCSPSYGAEHNAALFEQGTTAAGSVLLDRLYQGVVSIAQPEGTHSTTSFNTGSPGLEVEVEPEPGKKERVSRTNVLFGSGSWLSKYQGTFETIAKDPGIGVSATKLEYENPATKVWEPLVEHSYLEAGKCKGVQCYPEHGESWTLPNRLPDGEDKIRYRAEDAMSGTKSPESEGVTTLKVDATPPHDLSLTGLPLAGELRQTEYKVEAHATDGEGSTPNSGVKSLALFINGRLNSESSAVCNGSHGECTASAQFAIKGEQLALGPNDVAIQATDGAGNVSKPLRYTLTVRQSTPVALGPGSLDLESGDFTLASTDVSMGQGLDVSRTYSSRALTAGIEGPLGPQWSFSIANDESLTEVFGGSIMLTSANGKQAIFALNSEKHVLEPPPGDSNLGLAPEEQGEGKEKHVVAYILKNAAADTAVKFTQPTGEGTWVPTEQDGPVATDTVVFRYKTTEIEVEGQKKKVAEPLEAVAPTPTGVECRAGAPERGCRALTFEYASETNGETGEYKGRLMRVFFTAWNPAENKMSKPIAVAQYEYDSQGRLRTEWDPRISPALKTTYGYDEEGHVTALTPPGQEPWLFTYGSDANDVSPGRLIKVARVPASTPLKSREVPKNTEPPKLSGKAEPAVTMTVSQGAWSNEPAAYGFQWEECSAEGTVCTPIPGATNANYKVTDSNAGHALAVCVTATNQAGSSVVKSPPSEAIALGKVYPLPGRAKPESIVTGPDGNLWYTDGYEESINKITTSGSITKYRLPNRREPHDITVGPDGNLWYVARGEFGEGGSSDIGKITTSGTITEYPLKNGAGPWGITSGPEGNLWFTNIEGKIGRITTTGVITEYPVGEHARPKAITRGPDGNLWFTSGSLVSSGSIGKITPSGVVTEYPTEDSEPSAITQGPDGNLWFTAQPNNLIGKITPAGEVTIYTYSPSVYNSNIYEGNITSGPEGALWFTVPEGSDNFNGNLIGKITTAGVASVFTAPKKGLLTSVTLGPNGNLWYTNRNDSASEYEEGSARIGEVNFEASEGEHHPPEPGTTIEYHVPISGAGAPHAMGSTEVSAWAQQDDPVEATAIIAPDEPQGWPASSYKRATTYYLDEEGHTVNVATPGNSPNGSISTAEYNELNEPVRTLSPDNRETALQAGSNSVEVSRQLDTRNVYNGEGTQEANVPEPGTRLIETLGPQHEIRYKAGKEQKESLARERTEYFYDQGAPGGESTAREGETYQQKPGAERYDLLTESSSVAQLANRERVEVRTAKTSYSGQGGVGWKLRAPTSVTKTVDGSSLTSTTEYNEATGQIVAKKTPLGSASTSASSYVTSFGGPNTIEGSFKSPEAVAIDTKGNIFVADSGHDRILEFNEKHEYQRTFGFEGSENGQFKGIEGVATNAAGDVYATDHGNDRVQEFGPNGEFIRAFGSFGTGAGQLDEPTGIAVDQNGNVWVRNNNGGSLVEEFTAKGEYVLNSAFGKAPAYVGGMGGLAIANGKLYVVEWANMHVAIYSMSGKLEKQFDEGSGGFFWNLAADPATGNIFVLDYSNNRVQEFNSEGGSIATFGSTGSEPGEMKNPKGIGVGPGGKVFVVDTANERVEEWAPKSPGEPPAFSTSFGGPNTIEGSFKSPEAVAIDTKGNIFVADSGHDRILEFNEKHEYQRTFGFEGSENGQFKGIEGVATNAAGDVYATDHGNDRVQEFGPNGEFIRAFGSFGTGAGQLDEPTGIAVDQNGNVWVRNNNGGSLVEEFTAKGEYVLNSAFGKAPAYVGGMGGLAIANGKLYVVEWANMHVAIYSMSGKLEKQFDEGSGGFFWNLAADPATGNIFVLDYSNNRVQEFNSEGGSIATFGSTGSEPGEMKNPKGIGVGPGGKVFVVDTANERVEEWSTIRSGVHTSQIIYYTPKSEATISECQNHPEWAGLPCETKPVEQPETAGAPNLPVTKTTYNIWDEPVETVETFSSKERGTTERIKRQTYDEAGRLKTSETKSSTSEDAAVPAVEDSYSSATGLLVEQSTPSSGKFITSKFTTLGQLESYTDADGNTAKYSYEEPDGLVKEVRDSSNKGETYQRYSYDPTTKALISLEDSGAGTFTASYDAEGKLTSEVYPNEMCANTTYNAVGQATRIQYIKTANCSEEHPKVWYNDEVVPSIHGETLSESSTLAKDVYEYDELGRLTSVQETSAGQLCKTRLYEYDEESNRTSETQAEPNTKGECSTEGAQEHHVYDEADRLTDPGVTYDAFGNTTTLPATDAGGHELKSSFYVDNQVGTQTQNGKAIAYGLDPTGRIRETTCTSENTSCEGNKNAKLITHYDGPGEAVAWTSEGGLETRNIPGIDGTLCAIEKHGAPAVLQLHDLEGDTVATASLSPSATELASTYNSTEFGVPSEGKAPPKYAWLGASGVSTELSSGVVTDGAVSYVPETGRALQTEQAEPPGLPYGSGAGKAYTAQAEPWVWQGAARDGAEAPGLEATREQEAAEAACRANPVACLRFEDPAPKITYLTNWQAENFIRNIRTAIEAKNEASFVQFFFDLPGFLIDAVEEVFTGNDAEKWDSALAGKLEQCVGGLRSSRHLGGGCRVSQAETTVLQGCIYLGIDEKELCSGGVTVPNIGVPAEVSECWGWKPNGHLAWCYYLGP